MSSGAGAVEKTGSLARRIAAGTFKLGAVGATSAGGSYVGFGVHEWTKDRHGSGSDRQNENMVVAQRMASQQRNGTFKDNWGWDGPK